MSAERERETSQTNGLFAVESTGEWQIHDILFDGQERYLQPLVFSDHVAHLARKVDWSKICEELDAEEENNVDIVNGQASETSSNKVSKEAACVRGGAAGPWDKVAKALHQSLTELNVLADVLQIVNQQKYLTLEQISNTEANETNKGACLVGKRKALASASHCLITSSDRIKAAKTSSVGVGATQYQNELRELRRHWRLKKVGSNIVGDLSYKSYGSKFRPGAIFNVQKKDIIDGGVERSSLEVILPKELKEPSFITVAIETENVSIANFRLLDWKRLANSKPSYSWQADLLSAQMTLLSRDLFAQLAKESVHIANTALCITDTSISVQVYPRVVVHIRLENLTKKDLQACDSLLPRSHGPNGVLFIEEALYRMFCADLDCVVCDIPRPVSAPMGQPKRLRFAGAFATPAEDLADFTAQTDRFLLERVIEFAKHFHLVHQTTAVLEALSSQCSDPILASHWTSLNSLTDSSVRVVISSLGYEAGIKSVLSLDVHVDHIRIFFRDGECEQISNSVEDLLFLLKQQMAEHQLVTVIQLLKAQMWHVLGSNLHSSSEFGVPCPSVYGSTPSGRRSIFLVYPIDGAPTVQIQRTTKQNGFHSNFVPAEPWSELRGSFERVALDEVLGGSFIQKIENIIAALSDDAD